MYIPHLYTDKSLFILSVGMNRIPFEDFAEAEVCMIQRLNNKHHLAAVEQLKNAGMKVVYDLDDNLWDIPKYNPSKGDFEQRKVGIEVVASKCDLMTVSTEALRDAAYANMPSLKRRRIEVVPNAISLDLFTESKWKQPGFRVGWGGTATHTGDVAKVFDILPDVIEENEDIKLEFVGLPAPDKIQNHPRVKHIDFVPIAEYPARLSSWGWDLFLAPLEWNKFNQAKSNIKILEAAAIGSPILVSDTKEYARFCSMDKELKYLICTKQEDWKKKIIDLSHNPEYCKLLVRRMRKVVKEHFDIHKIAPRWQEVFESA